MNNFCFGFLLAVPVLLGACQNNTGGKTTAKTKDTLEIWVDSSLRVLMSEHKKAFENSINNPFVKLELKNEVQIINGLLSNQISCAVLHRKLSASEAEALRKREDFTPKQYEFAYDAFVCLSAENNPENAVADAAIRSTLNGRGIPGLELAVENGQAQAARFLADRYTPGSESRLATALFAPGSLESLVNYLRNKPGSVGVVPFSYIADPRLPFTRSLLNGLKTMAVSYRDSAGMARTEYPSQETICTREYPFVSPLVLINANMEKKSGTNFVNYLFKPKAQRLVLKCGLCPAIAPGREVIIQSK